MSAITKFISALTPSDIVQILGIIASFLTAIVAIIISLVTLRQNSKMLEESSRAVISVYSQSINTGTPILWFNECWKSAMILQNIVHWNRRF